MRSEVEHITPGDIVRTTFPRSVEDFWYPRMLVKRNSVFERHNTKFGTMLLYLGQLSSDDEIDASYVDQAPGDEAGYTPIVPWGWFLASNNLYAVSLSSVERV